MFLITSQPMDVIQFSLYFRDDYFFIFNFVPEFSQLSFHIFLFLCSFSFWTLKKIPWDVFHIANACLWICNLDLTYFVTVFFFVFRKFYHLMEFHQMFCFSFFFPITIPLVWMLSFIVWNIFIFWNILYFSRPVITVVRRKGCLVAY